MEELNLNVVPIEIRQIIYKDLVNSSIMNKKLKDELMNQWIRIQLTIVSREALHFDYSKSLKLINYLRRDIETRDDFSICVKQRLFDVINERIEALEDLTSTIWKFEIRNATFDVINKIIIATKNRSDCYMCISQYLQTRFTLGYSCKPYTVPTVRGFIILNHRVGKYTIRQIIKKGDVNQVEMNMPINTLYDDLQIYCNVIFQAGSPYIAPELVAIINNI